MRRIWFKTSLVERMPAFEYDPSRKFRAFLRTVIENRHRDLLRRRAARPAQTGENLDAVPMPAGVDFADVERLLTAACRAGVVGILQNDSSRFQLRKKCYPWIKEAFAPPVLSAEWRTATFFHKRLAHEDFASFAEAAFIGVADEVRRLARENDSRLVKSELVRLGIVEADAANDSVSAVSHRSPVRRAICSA